MPPSRRLWIAATLGLVLVIVAIRVVINFSHVYPPGTDAGYYPLQTWHWLTHGRLMYDDLPLIFWIDAAVARALMAAGWNIDEAVLLASRIVDCALPPWTAAFLMALGYRWSGGRLAAMPGCVAAAVAATLWQPSMMMLSEFQKNALGLVWMTAAVWACSLALGGGGRRAWGALGFFLGLSALTHIGAFGATVLTAGLALALWMAGGWLETRLVPWKTLTALGFAGAALAALFASFDSSRFVHLVMAPLRMLRSPGFGGRPGPQAIALLACAVIAAIVFRRVWRDREQGLGGDVAIAAATAMAALLLDLPKNPEYAGRLSLMAVVPSAISVIFLVSRRAAAGRSPWPGAALLAVSTAIAAESVAQARPWPEASSVIHAAGGAELLRLRGQIPDPDATLVMASHGFEWWAGYFLHTPVRQTVTTRAPDGTVLVGPMPADALTRYHRVLYLRQVPAPAPARPPAPPAAAGVSLERVFEGSVFEVYEVRRLVQKSP